MSDPQPVCLQDFEDFARKYLPRNTFSYFADGCEHNVTLRSNRDAFKRLKLRPRMLRDVSSLDISTSLLGSRVSSPIGISPTALHYLAHPEGEIATARGAQKAGACMIQSLFSNFSIEDVAEAAPGALKWMNVYIIKDLTETEYVVRNAEKAGHKAIVLTADSPRGQAKPVFQRGAPDVNRTCLIKGYPNFSQDFSELSRRYSIYTCYEDKLSWSVVEWLKSITKLPIVVKGILTGEDAELAVQHGASAIIVSNHGGRQLDSAPASIAALKEIVKVVDGRIEVFLDGGIREGTDVLKALALGAKAVFVGRPVIWGLAYDGERGVAKVLQILQDELKTAMALSGLSSVSEIRSCPNLVVREDYYCSQL